MSVYDHWGIQCGKGWEKIYQPLIDRCTKDGLRILQIKEKFGGLRFYVQAPHDHPIHELIGKAEKESLKTCESCGEPGTLRGDGWIYVQCDECAKERQHEQP
jgi:hypothetical protein